MSVSSAGRWHMRQTSEALLRGKRKILRERERKRTVEVEAEERNGA